MPNTCFCGTHSSPSSRTGLWPWPTQWNNTRAFAETTEKEKLFLPGNVDWMDYKPGAAGSHLVTSREVLACYPARKPRNKERPDKWRNHLSAWFQPYLKVGLLLDFSVKWANKFQFFLSYFELGSLSLTIEQILIDEEGLEDTKGADLEEPRRSNPGGRERRCKDCLQNSLGHLGNMKETGEAGI